MREILQIGNRIYYDKNTGKVLFQTGEIQGDILPRKVEKIEYIDLAFGDKTLENVSTFHIENTKIIIDKYMKRIETEEEKLRREKQELENQLLLQADNNLDGGIL
ncbi:hypothetical protein [Clostridium botulinum]|uniref:hypothetical protein n=1 Tax=Clostridium botulinum TaxID=1491 RepID=UPI002491FB93|nr:hypothetical protein [Clostridium botulinum]BDB02126.1 hypothetical protein CBOS2020_22000 [Clostridium botulinum]